MNLIELETLSKDSIFERAKELDSNDVDFLVDCLTEKNEKSDTLHFFFYRQVHANSHSFTSTGTFLRATLIATIHINEVQV